MEWSEISNRASDGLDIYAIDVDAAVVHRVTNSPNLNEENVRWSADGRQILYEQLTTYAVDLASVQTATPEFSGPQEPDELTIVFPGYPSPDGRWRAYTATVDGQITLLIGLSYGKDGIPVAVLANEATDILGWRPLR